MVEAGLVFCEKCTKQHLCKGFGTCLRAAIDEWADHAELKPDKTELRDFGELKDSNSELKYDAVSVIEAAKNQQKK